MALTTFTISLPADVADTLARKAARQGQDTSGLLRQLAEREAQTTPLWDTSTLAAWDTLLDSFSDGEEKDHRETVAVITRGHGEARIQSTDPQA